MLSAWKWDAHCGIAKLIALTGKIPPSETRSLYALLLIDNALPPSIKAVPHVTGKGQAEKAVDLPILYDSRLST